MECFFTILVAPVVTKRIERQRSSLNIPVNVPKSCINYSKFLGHEFSKTFLNKINLLVQGLLAVECGTFFTIADAPVVAKKSERQKDS